MLHDNGGLNFHEKFRGILFWDGYNILEVR